MEEGPRLVDPESTLVEETEVAPPTTSRRMIRAEAQLVRRYRNWLDPDGARLRGMVIPTAAGLLRADLFDTALNVLIEAKAEASRPHVRYAIGQLYDYRRYVAPEPQLAILFPSRLSTDLETLAEGAGVDVIWESGELFTDSAGGRLTSRSSMPGIPLKSTPRCRSNPRGGLQNETRWTKKDSSTLIADVTARYRSAPSRISGAPMSVGAFTGSSEMSGVHQSADEVLAKVACPTPTLSSSGDGSDRGVAESCLLAAHTQRLLGLGRAVDRAPTCVRDVPTIDSTTWLER